MAICQPSTANSTASRKPTAAVAARLIGLWKLEQHLGALVKLASADDTSAGLRAAAIEGIAAMGGEEGKRVLQQLSGSESNWATRSAAVIGLIQVDPLAGARQAAATLADAKADDDPSAIFDAVYRAKKGPGEFNKALGNKKLDATIATIGMRKANSSGRKLDWLAKTLQRVGSLKPMADKLTPQQMQEIVRLVETKGNAKRGEAIYRRAELACITCHAIAGSGGAVGPDMVSLGASAPVDYIVESLLEPNKKIKEGYHQTIVETKDGDVLTGTLVRKTDKEIVIRDATDRLVTINRKNVHSDKVGTLSMMPAGLTATLRQDEFVDLVRFMSELGKEGNYKVSPTPMARTWRVLQNSPTMGRTLRASSTAVASTDNPALVWLPAYSEVSGKLPMAALPRIYRFAGKSFGFARFNLEVTTPGKVALRFNDASGLQMWVGEKLIALSQETIIDLSTGTHRFTIAASFDERTAPLSVLLHQVEGSTAAARFVGGK